MGIPKFYSSLKRIWPSITYDVPHGFKCDSLYIDMNTVLHACLQRNTSMDGLLADVVGYIEALVDEVGVETLVFIAFDGVPPLAKLKQQAKRRHENSRSNKNVFFDTNSLSPGTVLMKDISSSIKNYIKSKLLHTHNHLQVILSDSSVPGEGEHKIMQHIRELYRKDGDSRVVIYGTDADIIILCLSLPNKEVKLIRDLTDKFGHKTRSEILDVTELKRHLLLAYTRELQEKVGVHSILLDIVLVFSMVGNDFLAAPRGWIAEPTTLTAILNSLCTFHSEFKTYIVDAEGKINKDHFQNLLKYFEDDEFRRFKSQKSIKKNVLDSKILALQLLGLSLKDRKNTVNNALRQVELEFFEEWKLKDYSAQTIKRQDIQKSLGEYFKGIQWLVSYYLDCCPSWTWLNPFPIVPYLSDLKKELRESEVHFDRGEPILPLLQLALISPSGSKSLLPLSYIKSDEYSKLSSLLTTSKEIGPSDITDFAQYFIDNVDPDLSVSEKERNKLTKHIIFK